MKKIDGHFHLVRSIAGLSGQGRMTPLGNGKAIWDNGTFLKLRVIMTLRRNLL